MTLIDDIRTSGEAIEHALHEGRIAFLGLLPDSDVLRAMVLVAEEARLVPGGLATLMAGDYADSPEQFCRRMHNALWRAAQMHHAEDRYAELIGTDRACDALLAESAGSGDDDA